MSKKVKESKSKKVERSGKAKKRVIIANHSSCILLIDLNSVDFHF